ncbi:hypothetical protein Scep_018115 [Stephania cephalantha]|uniref:Reverse transcriptase domain-containing protein n=1 Tax=Stephania cephalantha TaxID=152367 RepID=A0AAP0NU95_9MAGN
MRKLWKVRKELKTWNKEVFGSTQTRKDVLSARIKQLDDIEGGPNWNDIFLAERKRAKDEYANVLLIENRVASQKLRVKWVKEGDANTKFFHRILGARKSKNVIDRIQLQGGEFTEESSRIKQEIVDYYRHLYTNEMDSTWEINGINWGAIMGEEASHMERSFSEDEVWARYFFEMDKAPGPDGFTFAFIRRSWGVIKGDIMKFFEDFHSNGVISRNMNETFICLIPKGSHVGRIEDFRPISLVTSMYKLLANVLAHRLKVVLQHTIAMEQTAFVPDRQMMDSVLIASEVVEYARKRGLQGFVLKLDFAKAYDRVDWTFLDYVLQRKGFGERWRLWMKGCVSSAHYSVLINGRHKALLKDKGV